MKLGFTFGGIVLVLGLITSCNFNNDKRKSFDDAVTYNDFIVDHINALDSAYILALATDNGIDVCMRKCDSLVNLCDKTTEDLKGIQPFKGDSSLTMQALEYTQFMKRNGDKEIKDFLTLIQKYQDEAAELSEADEAALAAKVEESATKIDMNYDTEINKVDAVQKKLSKKFNFIILN